MLDANFVGAIKDLAKAALTPAINQTGESGPYYLQLDANGVYVPKVKRLTVNVAMLNVASIAAFSAEKPTDGRFYVSRSGIIYTYTHGKPETTVEWDRADFKLAPSQQIQQLTAWGKSRTPLSQDKLVPILRTTFREQVVPPTTLSALEAVTWKIGEDGQQTIGSSRRSMGRQLEAKLEGRSEIPEEVVFKIPAWDSSSFQFVMTVKATLEIDPTSQTFVITPFPNMIEAEWGKAEDALEKALTASVASNHGDAEGPAIYRGSI